MNQLLYHGILLAQRGRLDGFSKAFRGPRIDSSDVVVGVLILVGVCLAVWLLSYVLSLREGRRAYTSPLGLFLSLCKAHRLRWPERWLLWRVARAQRLRDPGRLFLEPQRLHPVNLGPSLQTRSAQLSELRERLFVRPEENSEEERPPVEPPSAEPQPSGADALPFAMPTKPALDVPPWPPFSATDIEGPTAGAPDQ